MTRLITLPKQRRSAPPTHRADASLPVSSSAIVRLEYDPDAMEMHVTFARTYLKIVDRCRSAINEG
jgi:hypothetical protein